MAVVITSECRLKIFKLLKPSELCRMCVNYVSNDPKINITPKFKFGESRENSEGELRTNSSERPVITRPVYPKSSQDKSKKNIISGDLLEIDAGFRKKSKEFARTNRKNVNEAKDFRFRHHREFQQQRQEILTSGEEILFGIHPVLLALRAKRRKIYNLLLKPAKDETQLNPRVEEIKNLAAGSEIPIKSVPKKILDHLSGQRPHQSVCLDVGILEDLCYEFSVRDLTTKATNRKFPVWVLLNKIHDPMNFGAIIRTAYYFGVDKLLRVKNDSCPPTPVVSKASSGALEITPISVVENIENFLQEKSEQGWEIIATTTINGSNYPKNLINLYDYELTKPVIVIIGNEGDGLEKNLMQCCTTHLTILPGFQNLESISSLNVSVATGIILHHLTLNFNGNSK